MSPPRFGSLLEQGTILGSYRVMQELGQGSMGVVYEAEHVKLGRHVALKVLRSELADNSELVARFFGEAKAVNRIAHENIVEVTDFCEDDGGHAYYIMELLHGETLGEVLARETTLPPARAVGIAVQICGAMSAVHEAGVVHRDLKPENVFLLQRNGHSDFVKILDFGVAKLAEARAAGVRETAAGTMLGTPQYMSPEQAIGRSIDHRTDIYALGVILYEMLSGHCPFEGKTIGEVIVKLLGDAARSPSSVARGPHPIPPAVERVVMRCIEKQLDRRYQTMGDVESALREAAPEAGVAIAEQEAGVATAPPASAAIPAVRRRRLPARAKLGTALAAIAAGLVVVGWLAFGGGHEGTSAAKVAGNGAARATASAHPAEPRTHANGTVSSLSASAPGPATSTPAPDAGKYGKKTKTAPKEDRNGTIDPFD